jgi:hypothetical protein
MQQKILNALVGSALDALMNFDGHGERPRLSSLSS